MEAVAWTAKHRLESPVFPDTWPEVLEAYYDRQEPTEAAVQAARWVLEGEAVDLVPGAFYVLSREDRRKLGAPPGDYVYKCAAGLELHFYKTWPGGRQ